MKKTIATLALILVAGSAQATVSQDNQSFIKGMLTKVGVQSMWSGPNSLWIKKPASINSKMELETLGYGICDATRGAGFYVVTFWHSLSGQGQITKVKCG